MKNLDEWELTRAFCNVVLRWGIQEECKRMDAMAKEAREYRKRIISRIKVDLAYSQLRKVK